MRQAHSHLAKQQWVSHLIILCVNDSFHTSSHNGITFFLTKSEREHKTVTNILYFSFKPSISTSKEASSALAMDDFPTSLLLHKTYIKREKHTLTILKRVCRTGRTSRYFQHKQQTEQTAQNRLTWHSNWLQYQLLYRLMLFFFLRTYIRVYLEQLLSDNYLQLCLSPG